MDVVYTDMREAAESKLGTTEPCWALNRSHILGPPDKVKKLGLFWCGVSFGAGGKRHGGSNRNLRPSHLAIRPSLDSVFTAESLDYRGGNAHHFGHLLDRVLEITLQVSQGHPLAEATLSSLVIRRRNIIVISII